MEKREVGLVEGLKSIYDEADSQGAFNSIKEKLFKKHNSNFPSFNTITGIP